MYDILLINNAIDAAYIINNLTYEECDDIIFLWFNDVANKDYMILNHGDRPDYVRNHTVKTIKKDQLDRYL